MIHVNGAGFCDDQIPILSTIGRGPKGPQGDQGPKGDTGFASFANPIEWDIDTDYPEYTIVLHDGNSYLSKVAVPNGISITNEDYWQQIGNYDAQIEQYRREVENITNLSYVGTYGAKENDPFVDWDSIVRQIADVSDTVYFGSGSWDVGTGIEMPVEIKYVIGSGALLYTTSPNDFLLSVKYGRCSVSGINFDGYGRVNRQLYCADSNRASISNCNFCKIGEGNIGIENEYIGCVVIGCTFNLVNTDENDYGGIGIKMHTDNQVVGCKFFHLDYAILARGVNVGNCYFWTSNEVDGVILASEEYLNAGDNTTANPNSYIYDAIFTNCEFDCVQTLVINPSNINISSCQFYWNDRDLTTKTPKLFVCDGSFKNMRGILFNDNVIKIQSISYDVYQFGVKSTSTADIKSIRITNYSSKDNVLTDSIYEAGKDTLTRFHMLIGLNTAQDNLRSSTNPNCYVKQELIYSPSEAIPSCTYMFDTTTGIFKYNRVGTVRDTIITNSLVRTGIKDYLTVFYDSYEVDYLPMNPFVINNVFVHISVPFMFSWYYPFNANPVSMPTGLNIKQSRQIVTEAIQSQ